MDRNHMFRYFAKTPDSDALRTCKESQKMYRSKQKTKSQRNCMESFLKFYFMPEYFQN